MEAKYEEVFDDDGKSRFKCLVCGKQVNLKNNMRQHVRNMHAKQTNNVCQYCQKEFKNNLSCQRHIKNNRCPILSTIASAQIIEYQWNGPDWSKLVQIGLKNKSIIVV